MNNTVLTPAKIEPLEWFDARVIDQLGSLHSDGMDHMIPLLLSIPEWKTVMVGYYFPALKQFRCSGQNYGENVTHFAKLPGKLQ